MLVLARLWWCCGVGDDTTDVDPEAATGITEARIVGFLDDLFLVGDALEDVLVVLWW